MGRKPLTDAERIRRYYAKHPSAKAKDMAEELGVNLKSVYNTMYNYLKKSRELRMAGATTQKLRMAFAGTSNESVKDLVNNPPHYTVGGIETIDFIEAKKLNYNLGNAVKYITRADHKSNRPEDLAKAIWYIKRELTNNATNNN